MKHLFLFTILSFLLVGCLSNKPSVITPPTSQPSQFTGTVTGQADDWGAFSGTINATFDKKADKPILLFLTPDEILMDNGTHTIKLSVIIRSPNQPIESGVLSITIEKRFGTEKYQLGFGKVTEYSYKVDGKDLITTYTGTDLDGTRTFTGTLRLNNAASLMSQSQLPN